MKIAVRTDASVAIGTGHVTRCLTLADVLRARGAHVKFVCRDHEGNAAAQIRQRGYECHLLPNASPPADDRKPADAPHHHAWLGVDQSQDAGQTLDVLDAWQPDWLIVDHYAIDARWERTLRPHVGRIMAIDDLADRPHDCDVLLDQNFYSDMAQRYDALVPAHCQRLLGPAHALLRPEFLEAGRTLQRDFIDVRRILVFMGGFDASNEVGKTLSAIDMLSLEDIQIDAVLGGNALHLSEVRRQCAAMPNVTLHVQTDDMAGLMTRADMAVGACGTATWERCIVGLPSMTIVLADNQRRSAHDLDAAGIVVNLGEHTDVTPATIARGLAELIVSPEQRVALSSASRALTSPHRSDAADLICARSV